MSDAVLTKKTVSVGGRWLWRDQRNSGILVRLVGSLCILKVVYLSGGIRKGAAL